jgi:alkane 1-monooxygenase
LAPANRFLQGLILELLIVVGVFTAAGMGGLGAFLASTTIGILVIELSNYVAHYGLVRVPGQAVEPRHSWNAPRLVTTSLALNLTRHAHHHEDAGRRYWKLTVLDDAPIYPFGLGIMETIALMPPIWFRCVHPLLEDWDRRLASAEELELLHKFKSVGVVDG